MNSSLFNYLLQMADDSAILGQRLGEWCGHGPALEIDMALTNISLDLFGQARTLYQYAAEVEGKGKSEDDLAFLRDGWDFKNVLLVEQPNGDFAHTIVRQYLFDVYQFYFLDALRNSKDSTLAAYAEKSWKETAYHLRFSREWMKRLGGGTSESHQRLQTAIDAMWRFKDELIQPTDSEKDLATSGIAVDLSTIQESFNKEIADTIEECGVKAPENTVMQFGGRDGVHSEYMGFILAEMQVLQRTYPGQQW